MQDQLGTFYGTIGKILPIETKNTYQWRYLWVCRDSFYKKKGGELVNKLMVLEFKLLRSNVSIPENIGLVVGSDVAIDYYLDGSLYNNRPWMTLIVHRIMNNGFTAREELGLPADAPKPVIQTPQSNLVDLNAMQSISGEQDLPF